MKAVVIYGHPHYQDSFSNNLIISEVARLAPSAEIVNLTELYPDYKIDVEREQERLKDADLIVFQFPVWWYGLPSIINRYIEEVFSHGYAYGSEGKALKGKRLVLSYTAGAKIEDYTVAGAQHHSLQSSFLPIYQMASLCSLGTPQEVASYGMMVVDTHDTKQNELVKAKALAHGADLADLINIES